MTPEERRPRASSRRARAKRYRCAFERTGRAAFESHLDLVRLVPRVFRRAELPMFYSQGFHPKPEMMFGPALALGVSTLDEYVDVKLACDVDPEALPALLQPGAPDGLVFVARDAPGPNDPGINKVIDAAEYVAALPWTWLRAQGRSPSTTATTPWPPRATRARCCP
jgi:radical SAM-linked protein